MRTLLLGLLLVTGCERATPAKPTAPQAAAIDAAAATTASFHTFPGNHVVFHRADGSVAAVVVADQDGDAVGPMPETGMITDDDTIGFQGSVTTYVGVAPGARFGGPAVSPPEPAWFDVEVLAPAEHPGADRYEIRCAGGRGAPGAVRCAVGADRVVALALDAGGQPIAYAVTPRLTAAQLAAPVALPPWRTDWRVRTVSFRGLRQRDGKLALIHVQRDGDDELLRGWAEAPIQDGEVTMTIRTIDALGVDPELEYSITSARSQRTGALGAMTSDARTVTEDDLLGEVVHAELIADPARPRRPTLRWRTEGDVDDVDELRIDLWGWRLFVPAALRELVLPELPEGLAGAPTGVLQLSMVRLVEHDAGGAIRRESVWHAVTAPAP